MQLLDALLNSLTTTILDEQRLVEEFFFGAAMPGASNLQAVREYTPSTVTINNLGTNNASISLADAGLGETCACAGVTLV